MREGMDIDSSEFFERSLKKFAGIRFNGDLLSQLLNVERGIPLGRGILYVLKYSNVSQEAV